MYSYFEKGCRKLENFENVQATIPKGNMGYDQHAVLDTTVAVESSIVTFL